jgi:hypothetical protein
MVLHYDLVEWAEELPDELKSDPSKGQIGTPTPRLIVHHDLTDKFVSMILKNIGIKNVAKNLV